MSFIVSKALTKVFGWNVKEVQADPSGLIAFKDHFYARDPIPTDKAFWDDILDRCDRIASPADRFKAADILYGWYPPLMAEGKEAVLEIRRGLMTRLVGNFQTPEQFQKICRKDFLSSDILGRELVQASCAALDRLDSEARDEVVSALYEAVSKHQDLLPYYREIRSERSGPSANMI